MFETATRAIVVDATQPTSKHVDEMLAEVSRRLEGFDGPIKQIRIVR